MLEKLNLKVILIIALSAALISILSGLIGGVNASSVFFRAFIVLLFFSVFAAVINFVSVTFLDSGSVENQTPNKDNSGSEGSNVNIVLTEDDEALSELGSVENEAQSDEFTEQLPEDLKSQGYESDISGVDQSKMSSIDIDTLPDLGSFSTTFMSASENEEKNPDSDGESGYNKDTSFSSGSRQSPDGLAGKIAEQNSPEDLAKAVKTVLKR